MTHPFYLKGLTPILNRTPARGRAHSDLEAADMFRNALTGLCLSAMCSGLGFAIGRFFSPRVNTGVEPRFWF